MDNNTHIDKLIEESLHSADGAGRATPRPFLLTRIMARMQRKKESAWDKAVNYITRPAFVIAGLCLVLGVNAMAIAFNNDDPSTAVAADQIASIDDFSTSVTTLYDIENNEP
jgi:hypothetical protein